MYLSFGAVAASIAPLVAVVEQDLAMSHAAMGSVMGAWQLVYIFAAVPAGILLDRIGGRQAMLLGIALVALSALGRAFAHNYWTLLAAVMVFGLGGPIISSGAPKMVAGLFAGSQRGLAMGIYMTGPALGGVACLTLTHGVLMPWFDMNWRWVMLMWGALAVVSGLLWAVLGHRLLPGRPNPAVSTDMPQTGSMRALIELPAVRLVLLMSVGVFLYNHGLNNWLPELLRTGGMSPASAGYWAALPTVVGIFGSLLIPRLATPQRRFPILLALCGAALAASVLLRFDQNLPLTAGLILQGIARSSLMTVLVLTLVQLPGVGDQRAGTASGMFFAAAEIGGMLGPLGIGVMYDLSGQFNGALTALSVVCAAMMIGTARLSSAARR